MGAALALVAVLTMPVPADTVVEMRRGERVVLENVSGELLVEGTERDALELIGEEREVFVIERRGGALVVRGGRRGARPPLDLVVRVPRWADVEIRGRDVEVTAARIGGSLDVANGEGDVSVRDVGGPVQIRTLDGEIRVERARDGVRATSQSDDVTVLDAVGPIEVHSGSGDVVLRDVRSSSVRAETRDGDIDFAGAVLAGGRYGFFVHDGDATVAVPGDLDARVRVSTFDGEFTSDFPVVVQRFQGGRSFDFVVGNGAATVEIEVFDGEIRLLSR